MRTVMTASVLTLSMMVVARPAAAQEFASPGSRTAVDGVEFVTGLMDFDLSGTGTAMPFAVRGSKALTSRLALEFGATLAAPEQQFGPSRMIIPEAQLSYSWRFGRVRPFVSGGGGLATIDADPIDRRWHTTLSGGGGARIQVTDRMYAIGEMRLRGISRDFSSTTAEWLGGIGWSVR